MEDKNILFWPFASHFYGSLPTAQRFFFYSFTWGYKIAYMNSVIMLCVTKVNQWIGEIHTF